VYNEARWSTGYFQKADRKAIFKNIDFAELPNVLINYITLSLLYK